MLEEEKVDEAPKEANGEEDQKEASNRLGNSIF